MQMLLVLKNKEMEKVPGKSWHFPALPIRCQLFPAGGSKGNTDLSVSWSRAPVLAPACPVPALPQMCKHRVTWDQSPRFCLKRDSRFPKRLRDTKFVDTLILTMAKWK